MTLSDLQSMTVIQLRKIAKENQITLGAGLEKTAMIEKIASALGIENVPIQQSFLDQPDAPSPKAGEAAGEPSGSPDEPAPKTEEEPGAAVTSDAAADAPVPEEAEHFVSDSDAVLSSPVSPENRESSSPEKESGMEKPFAFRESGAPKYASRRPAGTEFSVDPSEPRFQAAWHSPDSPQSGPHASYSSTGTNRPAWQNTTPSGRPLTPEQRPQPLRPHSFGPRFGPAASRAPESVQESPAAPERTERQERQVRPAISPLPDRRIGFPGSGSFGPAVAASAEPAPAPASAPVAHQPAEASPAEQSTGYPGESSSPTLEELLSAGEFEEGGGILELHPDGYGFLRASNYLPSSRDIYVSMAQIRRFSLRTGDLIRGKIRPQREGDKFAALLYIDSVNGLPEEESLRRPIFDELTPVYPSRRMSLENKNGPSLPDMRLIDLIAPLGFGQRGLLLCPPETGKRELLQHYANTIASNDPDVELLVLLIDLTPEDVTEFRESVPCPVLASTFDQTPEAHLRLTEMVVERAMRLVEQKKDVVILADSLTRLAKIYTSAAVQQGRSLPGMVNPASLLRAKRMFGAARALKEGGSLTVIATMDIASGNKVDDSVVEEFKGTANMELCLDQSLARAGIFPAIHLQKSFTKNADLLLNDQQKEGLNLIRTMLGSTSSAVAIPQLLSMMEKTSTNSELLLKMKDWFALMNM